MYHLTLKSRNVKTGPIPVSTSTRTTCPLSCPFNNGQGCYAASGPLALHWAKVSEGHAGTDYDKFLVSISALPLAQLWRHNQSGDFPGDGDEIDSDMLARLVEANRGKHGFSYTHKPLNAVNAAAIAHANANGFTVNLSGNTPAHADELAAANIGPVVVVLPADVRGNAKLSTPSGRRIVVCPATYREQVSCATCGLCQVRDRGVIVGFPAHGTSKRKADSVARG